MSYKQIAFIFPGQGAQYTGMGKDFFDAFSIVRETFEEADDLLQRKLSQIVFQGPDALLTETKNSQSGIYTTSIALMRAIRLQFPLLQPSVCAGLSLGEYTALTASLRLPFNSCLPLVQARGELMNQACESIQGSMAVVMGLDAEVVENMVKEISLPYDLWVANFNCPGQVVLSGTLKGIQAGTEAAKAKGAKRVLPLQVHGAFHSGLMQSAEEGLADRIKEAPFTDSSIGLVMNAPGGYVKELADLRHWLLKQVTSSVRWEQGVRAMDLAGVDLFVEIGCGNTLAGMNKRIGVKAPTITIQKLADLDQLANL